VSSCNEFVSVFLVLVVRDFPKLSKYLKADSKIVKHPVFERAVAKLSVGNENLDDNEKAAVTALLIPVEVIDEEEREPSSKKSKCSYAEDILHEAKDHLRPKIALPNKYMDTSFIPPTSVAVERFFSVAGFVLGERRLSILPVHAEEQLFLRVNRSFWKATMLMDAFNEAEPEPNDAEVIVIDDDVDPLFDLDSIVNDVIVIDD
jgi:hypothetical protein